MASSFFTQLIAAFLLDGSSNEPDKEEMRVWGDEVEDFIHANGWRSVVKQADQAKSADTTLAADAELVVPLAANTKYLIRGTIFFDTAATPDLKWRHAGPASPTLIRVSRRHVIPGTTAFAGIAVDTAYSAADITMTGTGTDGGYIEFEAIIHNGANAGNFSFQWAQNTSDAGATTVRAGSRLDWRPVTTNS